MPAAASGKAPQKTHLLHETLVAAQKKTNKHARHKISHSHSPTLAIQSSDYNNMYKLSTGIE